MNESDTLTKRENISSTSVRVTTKLHDKHAHANEVIAVIAFESVGTFLLTVNLKWKPKKC